MRKLSELGISPAPWKIGKDSSGWIIVRDARGMYAATPDGDEKTEAISNARLIAAAPKLYQALYKITKEQECGRDCSKCKNDGCVIQECRAALAEAAGEEVAE